MNYLHWDEKTIPNDSSGKYIADMYDRGYLFTRKGKGVMHQTRSVRIDLNRFELTSENRRILKKVGGIEISDIAVFAPPTNYYNWEIGKLAKDFYETKFGPGIMSAQKIKEMLTDPNKSNFNTLLGFAIDQQPVGYAICYKNVQLLHYSYPFYDSKTAPKDMGLGMMLNAIEFAKDNGLQYAYLGSLQRPGDTYKLQFAGLEWFDSGPGSSGKWSTDIEDAKKLLKV